MATMTIQGVSTCQVGQESYERFRNRFNQTYFAYDYRAADGSLFACVAKSLRVCRIKRDFWLSMKE